MEVFQCLLSNPQFRFEAIAFFPRSLALHHLVSELVNASFEFGDVLHQWLVHFAGMIDVWQ